MKVVLVAPQTDDLLYAHAEVQSIVNSGIIERSLLGDVRAVDLVREMMACDCSGFWFCGHATPEGIVLSDGLFSSSQLTPLIRGKFDMAILNSCESIQTAIMLQNETDATVVATVVEVPDKEAFQTGALLANELARSGDIEAAYNRSRPGGNRTYLLLAGKKK